MRLLVTIFSFISMSSLVCRSQSQYHYKTLKQFTVDCFTLFPEFLYKGVLEFSKDQDILAQQKMFYKNLKGDINTVLDLFISDAHRVLTDRGQWLKPDQVFEHDHPVFNPDASLTKKTTNAEGKEVYHHDIFIHPFTQRVQVDPGSKILFMGDIHCSIHSLLRCLWHLLAIGYIDNNFNLTKDNFYMVFNGDFVNRGNYGCEVLYTLLRLKEANMNRVFLVRGNHEDPVIQDKVKEQGLPFEIARKYHNKEDVQELRQSLNKLFELLPLGLFIACNGDTVQSCHGGIEPGYAPRDFIRSHKMFNAIQKDTPTLIASLEKKFLFYPYKTNNFKGLNWTDFTQSKSRDAVHEEFDSFIKEHNIDELTLDFPYRACLGNFFRHPKRSSGYMCNVHAAREYLKFNGLKAIFRAHQDKGFGFKMLFDPVRQKDKLDVKGAPKEGVISDFGTIRYASGKRKDPGYHDGPFHWTEVVSQEDAENKEGFLVSDYFPVFVFSSAPEGRGLPHDCFGIVTTADSYEQWRLKPYEIPLVHERNNKYVHVQKKDIEKKYVDVQTVEKLNIRFSHHEKPVERNMLEISLDKIIKQAGDFAGQKAEQEDMLDWFFKKVQSAYSLIKSLFGFA